MELFVKLKSVRKLGNFNFQWTKTLYQNNFKHIASHFLRAINVLSCRNEKERTSKKQ